jgi:hypothetical protein
VASARVLAWFVALGRPGAELEEHRHGLCHHTGKLRRRLLRHPGHAGGATQAGHGPGEVVGGPGQDTLDGGGEHVLLGGEVAVDAALGHPRGFGDVADGDLAVAPGLESLDSGVGQPAGDVGLVVGEGPVELGDHLGASQQVGQLTPDVLEAQAAALSQETDQTQGGDMALVVAEAIERRPDRRGDQRRPPVMVDGAGRHASAQHQIRQRKETHLLAGGTRGRTGRWSHRTELRTAIPPL